MQPWMYPPVAEIYVVQVIKKRTYLDPGLLNNTFCASETSSAQLQSPVPADMGSILFGQFQFQMKLINSN